MNINFTAFDVETASSASDSICQIGIVRVSNSVITEKYMFLVQPPENQYEYHNIKVHGITPNMTVDAPAFSEIWNKIAHLFDRTLVVAHNISFDVAKLEGTLNRYGIEVPQFNTCCTMKQYNSGLKEACIEKGIELYKHHDALVDAEACALLYLLCNSKEVPINADASSDYFFSQKRIEKYDLIPNFEVEEKNNPFYKKKVVFTGDLDFIDRKEAAHALKLLGADVNTSISKKTDIVIIGKSPGPSKIEKINCLMSDGYNIEMMNQSEFEIVFRAFCNND